MNREKTYKKNINKLKIYLEKINNVEMLLVISDKNIKKK